MSDESVEERLAGSSRDRGTLIGVGAFWLAKWSLATVSIAAGAWVLGWLVGHLWVILLPVLLALVVSTVLWPPTRLLRRVGFPPALAAATSLILFFIVVGGVLALIVPSVVSQAPELADKATDGVGKVQDLARGTADQPARRPDRQRRPGDRHAASGQRNRDRIGCLHRRQHSRLHSGDPRAGVGAGFFFVKDGPKFLPWLHAMAGAKAGVHLAEVLRRVWDTLGGFIRTQAVVSMIDAVFIGAGLLILGVPLAPVLAITDVLRWVHPDRRCIRRGRTGRAGRAGRQRPHHGDHRAGDHPRGATDRGQRAAADPAEQVDEPARGHRASGGHRGRFASSASSARSLPFRSPPPQPCSSGTSNEQIDERSDEKKANVIAREVSEKQDVPGDEPPKIVHDDEAHNQTKADGDKAVSDKAVSDKAESD